MEVALSKDFCEMSENEILEILGGGWVEAGLAFTGCVLIGASPVVGVAAGIGASVVATPIIGIAAGVAAGSSVAAAGAACLDLACSRR